MTARARGRYALAAELAMMASLGSMVGCGDDGSEAATKRMRDTAARAGDAASTDGVHDAGAAGGDGEPQLKAPAHGAQLSTKGHSIPASADQEWCEVLAVPGSTDESFFVGSTELAMTPFSHHLIVSFSDGPTPGLDAAPLGEPVPCTGAHEYGTNLMTLTATATPYNQQALPDGVGFTLRGGQRLLFDYHAFNTSERSIYVRSLLNLHFVDHIDKPARVFGFYNQYIRIPAHSQRRFSDECRLKDDLLIWSLSRHTHRQGTDFRVWWVGGKHDGELLWTSTDWEQDILYRFDAPTVLPAGTGFRWECAYDNPTDSTLAFGPQATDEMCILFGAFAAVADDADVGSQSCYLFQPSGAAASE